MSAIDIIDASSSSSSVPGRTVLGPRASRRPCRWPRNSAVLSARSTPASRSALRAAWEVVSPYTSPRPACRHSPATWAAVRVFPEPAGPTRISARRSLVTATNAAAAWSSRSPEPVVCCAASAARAAARTCASS